MYDLSTRVDDGVLMNERREQDVHSHRFIYVNAPTMIEVTDDDRVLQRLSRIGEPGQFAPVSSNGSVTDISTRLLDIREQHHPAAYELHVIASAVDDVVRSVGGWLFDRVRAGWTVNVLVPRDCDPRSLHILGVRVFELESTLALLVRTTATGSLAVSSEIFSSHPELCNHIAATLRHQHSEVTFWGSGIPAALTHGLATAIHRLSTAAVAFKSQALLAATASYAVGSSEELLRVSHWSARDAEVAADIQGAARILPWPRD